MDNIYDNDDQETPQAKMGDATLGGVSGKGTLQIVRGPRADKILDIVGTWRLADEDAGSDVSEIHKAHEEGRMVRYTGRLDDPDYPNIKEVDTEVRITSIGTYHTTPQEGGDEGEERTFYNYDVTGSLPYTDEEVSEESEFGKEKR